MNVILYNEKDLQTLYNKYRISSYYPSDTMKSSIQPQHTAIGNNLIVNSSINLNNNINNNPLGDTNNYIQNIKPIPSVAERNR